MGLDNCLLTVLRKGRKERKVPFSIELRKALYKCIPRSAEEFVFGTSTGTRLTRRNAHRDVTKACKRLNIEKPARLLPMLSSRECTRSFYNDCWGIQQWT